MRYAFFHRNFFTKNERPKKKEKKRKVERKKKAREREREGGGRESCYKFFENLCGIIQRIPAHSHSYLHAPP
jgi:hypothetical protein